MTHERCCDSALLVKICGLTRQADVDKCLELKADLAGFVFHEGSPRNISPKTAADIDTGPLMRVGVFVRQNPAEVRAIMRQADLHLAQLHGDQNEEFCDQIGKKKVMRVFWPARYATREALEAEIARFDDYTRFVLLDAGQSGGGHGESLDFTLLKGLACRKTWFLAGGLGPENICQALGTCAPCGVDLNSGVESAPGIKDHERLIQTFAQLCRIAG